MSKSEVLAKGAGVARGACAVCGGALTSGVVVRLLHSGLRECTHCRSWVYFPRGDAEEQASRHDNEEYFEHPYFALRRTVTPELRRRCREVFQRMSAAIDPADLRGERLLDIGCDTGVFLKSAQEEFGIVPVGIDVAARAVNLARQQGIEAHQLRVEQASAVLSGFPAATAVDLIEHVADPGSFLRSTRALLKPGGVLYVETPNLRSAVFAFGRRLSLITGGRPAFLLERLFPPQHVQMFTIRSLRQLAEASGFEVVDSGSRVLPSSDIAATLVQRLGIDVLQFADRVFGTEILIWAVLRRAEAA